MTWQQADRYLTGVGGTRNRRLLAEQLLRHTQALASRPAQQHFERGVSIAAAGMVGTSNSATGAVSGGGAVDTIVESTAGNDDAIAALRAADRLMGEALTKLRDATQIWAEYARLADNVVDITPGICCEPTWQALRIVVPVHVRTFKPTPDSTPMPVGEPVYNFHRSRGRLPTARELEQWLANDRRWPARGKRAR